MNKLISLSLIAASIFLASCSGNGGDAKEYNIVYQFSDADPMATIQPTVTGPTKIKVNEEATVTLTYSYPCIIGSQEQAISSFDNISIKDYQEVEYNVKATFKIFDVRGDAVITFFKFEPQP